MLQIVKICAFIMLAVTTLTSCEIKDPNSFTLRIGSGHPAGPAVYATQMRDFFVPEVERRVAEETNYKVNFVEGYGGSIASAAETLEAVQSGILDIGGYCVCFEPSKLFLHNFMYFTPFSPSDSSQSVAIAREIYNQHPWLEEQLNHEYKQRLLALNGWDNYHLGTVRPWQTISDLRGVKIGGAGPNLPWLEYAGAIPVQSTLPDGYLALETGVYDGWLMFPSAYYSFKFHEPAPYYTLINFGAMGGAVIVTMNNKRFEKLPPEVQKIIEEVAREYETVAAQSLNTRQAQGLIDLEKSGATISELPVESRAAWAQSLAAFPNEMAKEANSRGMPGSEIMTSYITEISKSDHQWLTAYTIEPSQSANANH